MILSFLKRYQRNILSRLFLLLIFLPVIFYFFSDGKVNYQKCRKAYLLNNTDWIELDIAYTRTQKALGLMFIKKLPQNKGMIFVFDKEEEHTFWMKNTYIPLDIIFLTKDYRVAKIFENVRASFPGEDDENVEYVTHKGKYVIEINAGMSKKMSLAIGKKLKLKWDCDN
mgnify:CR=1 FL=1